MDNYTTLKLVGIMEYDSVAVDGFGAQLQYDESKYKLLCSEEVVQSSTLEQKVAYLTSASQIMQYF